MMLPVYGVALVIVAVVGIAAASIILPARSLPDVSVPYAISSMELRLAPAALSRDKAAAPRTHVWYPVIREIGQHAPRRRFPVLLYFPGWPGGAADNLILVRALASQGYIVAAVEYPGYSSDSARAAEPLLDFSSAEHFQDSMRRNDERVRTRAQDAVAILDRLEIPGAVGDGEPTHRLETGRVGILGYSFGGAIAAEACRLDRRFAAAVNMDGLHFAGAAHQGVEQPYLLISDGAPPPTRAELESVDPRQRHLSTLIKTDYEQALANLERHGGTFARLDGARHVNFSDAALRWPFRWLGGTGSIDPARAHGIIQAYVLAFFAKHLQDEDSPLLAGNSARYPEMQLRIWERPGGVAAFPDAVSASR